MIITIMSTIHIPTGIFILTVSTIFAFDRDFVALIYILSSKFLSVCFM